MKSVTVTDGWTTPGWTLTGPSLWVAVPLFTHFVDPLIVVGHLGVDAQFVYLATALAPGHQAQQEPGVPIQGDHRTTTVPLAGVHTLAQDPGTKDVFGDVVRHLAAADVVVDQRHLDDIECRAEMRAVHVVFAPTCHHCQGAVLVQFSLCHLFARQANWEDVVGVGGGALQAKHGDVIVDGPAVVVWVFERFDNLYVLFGSLQPVAFIVACRQKADDG